MEAKIAILGSGAWGLALAKKLSQNNKNIWLWGRNKASIDAIKNSPSHVISETLQTTTDFHQAIENAEGVLVVTPSVSMSEILGKITTSPKYFAWASKGFSQNQCGLIGTDIEKKFSKQGVFLTGPTFADEVMKDKPTAILAAGDDQQTAYWQKKLSNKAFRVYTCSDMISAQTGAAVKNIIAIAVGISDGLEYGANARAAIITRGLRELEALNKALGGKEKTIYGLSGLGDIVLTSTSNLSRNRQYGLALGRDEQSPNKLVEGYYAVQKVVKIAQQQNIELPICESVYKIITKQQTATEVVQSLLNRPLKEE